jgi:hypothetical protein
MLELERYCDEFQRSDYSRFPTVSQVQKNGYARLHSLIQYYGGRKFLALRLGMDQSTTQTTSSSKDLNWGSFDLDFGIQLLLFVRNYQLTRRPPVKHPVIAMPSPAKLFATDGGESLHRQIVEFGGFENVARRLGLAFDSNNLS